MAQSAYPHGANAVMIEDNVGSDPDVAQVIASELQAVGIHVQLKIMADSAYEAIFTGPADKRMTTFSGGGCFSPDPSNYTDFLGSTNLKVGQYNVSDYAPAAVDSLIAAGLLPATRPSGLRPTRRSSAGSKPTCRTWGFSTRSGSRPYRASSSTPSTAPTPGRARTCCLSSQRHRSPMVRARSDQAGSTEGPDRPAGCPQEVLLLSWA